jgi:hypothetical protein
MKVRLVPAAMPRMEYAGGKGQSIDLIWEGLEMMVRLGWTAGKRAMGFGRMGRDRKD